MASHPLGIGIGIGTNAAPKGSTIDPAVKQKQSFIIIIIMRNETNSQLYGQKQVQYKKETATTTILWLSVGEVSSKKENWVFKKMLFA